MLTPDRDDAEFRGSRAAAQGKGVTRSASEDESASGEGIVAGPASRSIWSWFRSAMLWALVLLVTFCVLVYQRRTGPTYPFRGTIEVAPGAAPALVPLTYELLRSEESTRDARIAIPQPGPGLTASVFYKRFNTQDPWTELPMQPEPSSAAALGVGADPRLGVTDVAGSQEVELVAYLPRQPAAGKLEYFVNIYRSGPATVAEEGGNSVGRGVPDSSISGDEDARLSAGSEPLRPVVASITGADDLPIVIRFKDPVPAAVLVPHIVFMLLSMVFGIRAGLASLLAPRTMRVYAWVTLAGLTVGGMILGPIVQKHAFGAYWTGFPFGGDLTDNKTLIMWIAWLLACLVLGWRARARLSLRIQRAAVVLAALTMTAAYLIPHSMRGSELDYAAVDAGVDPADAIGTSGQ